MTNRTPSTRVHRIGKLSGPKDIMCALCDQPMGAEEEWVGDIAAAVSLRDVQPLGNARRIHKSCGDLAPEFVEDAIQKRNRRRPKLRLRPVPWSWRYAPFKIPIPNLNICVNYFDEYELALSKPDALQRISDLLLRFRREHPVEWECCGWKNDAIADVVLGRAPDGYVEHGRAVALGWLGKHWQYEEIVEKQLARDLAPKRMAAFEAVFDLDMIEWDARAATASDAFRRGDSLEWNAAFDKSITAPHTRFLRWVNESWEQTSRNVKIVPSNSQEPPLAEEAWLATTSLLLIKKFRKAYPDVNIGNGDLVQLCNAYYQERRTFDDVLNIPPSAVLIRFVAARHEVSPATVRRVRAEIGKRVIKSKQARGKSARTSGRT
jgi:hypothetical protein